MSDAMTEIYRGTYFKDRSKLNPKTKNNKNKKGGMSPSKIVPIENN